MPTAAAQPAINTLFKLGTAGCPQTFSTIANVGDYTGPSMSGTIVDVTSHSTGSPWRQKIVTLLDNGDISLPLFFIPSDSGHDASTGLLSIFTTRALREYSITFPDPAATTWYVQGYVSKFNMKAPVAGVLTADVTFTLTAEPILAG